jgi:acyl-coenzyme A thioesterase PaaI-like protein
LPDGAELVMRVMPMPADVNANGDIFGGWIMAQVDVAGAVLPVRVARGRIATVAVNQFIFKQPVSIGDLLSFYARVTRIGRTSMTVHVEVWAERNPVPTARGGQGHRGQPDLRGHRRDHPRDTGCQPARTEQHSVPRAAGRRSRSPAQAGPGPRATASPREPTTDRYALPTKPASSARYD